MPESKREATLRLHLLECRDLLQQVLHGDTDALDEYGDQVIARADEALGREGAKEAVAE